MDMWSRWRYVAGQRVRQLSNCLPWWQSLHWAGLINDAQLCVLRTVTQSELLWLISHSDMGSEIRSHHSASSHWSFDPLLRGFWSQEEKEKKMYLHYIISLVLYPPAPHFLQCIFNPITIVFGLTIHWICKANISSFSLSDSRCCFIAPCSTAAPATELT